MASVSLPVDSFPRASFTPGEIIFVEGEPGNTAYIVLKGEAQVVIAIFAVAIAIEAAQHLAHAGAAGIGAGKAADMADMGPDDRLMALIRVLHQPMQVLGHFRVAAAGALPASSVKLKLTLPLKPRGGAV